MLSSMLLLGNVVCGGSDPSAEPCTSAEYFEYDRNMCFDNGGLPLPAAYEVVIRPWTTRTEDLCRYAAINEDALNRCLLANGVPYVNV